MKNIDDKIRQAMSHSSDPGAPRQNDIAAVFQDLTDVMRGRYRWLNAFAMILTLAFLAVAVFAAIKFFQSREVRDLILYAAVFLFSMQAVGLLKIWFWMEMERHSIAREIKRVQLELVHLRETSHRGN